MKFNFNYDSLLNCLQDRNVRYVSVPKTTYKWFRNRDKKYTFLSLENVGEKYKKSDTIFILGGSDSINDITKDQWDYIAQHDSIGMNWWPVHEFIPTYYYTNYPRNKVHFKYFQSVLERHLKNYNNTIFFLSDRVLRRGIHPQAVRRLFPKSPVCCLYNYQDPIRLDKGNLNFKAESFERTIYYRGGLSLILDLMYRLKYKNIILMGVDLRHSVHFYDKYPEMQWQFSTGYCEPLEVKDKKIHATMNTKEGTKISMAEYLYAVNDLFFKSKEIKLFVGSSNSILIDKIPLYSFSG